MWSTRWATRFRFWSVDERASEMAFKNGMNMCIESVGC